MEKHFRALQATDYNMAHALCKLDIKGYKHKQRMCNIHFFSTAKMVARTCLSVYVIRSCSSHVWYTRFSPRSADLLLSLSSS